MAGIANVYCKDGAALLQFNNGCSNDSYGESDNVTLEQCGYLSADSVKALAEFAIGVRLIDEGRGEVNSTNAMQALIDGTSWHVGGVTWTGYEWRFANSGCNWDTKATGWPNMNYACGRIGGVYWITEYGHTSCIRRRLG